MMCFEYILCPPKCSEIQPPSLHSQVYFLFTSQMSDSYNPRINGSRSSVYIPKESLCWCSQWVFLFLASLHLLLSVFLRWILPIISLVRWKINVFLIIISSYPEFCYDESKTQTLNGSRPQHNTWYLESDRREINH